jgi:hypothetical protein
MSSAILGAAGARRGMIDIVQVAASGVSDFFWSLDSNQITALATAVSALFAGTIFLINWRQLRHTRNVERAYISGGGPLDANDLNKFLFTVNNYGKTPGILTEYAVEFCSLTDIRSVPPTGSVGTNTKHFTIASRPVESRKRGSWHRSTSRRLLVRCSFMGAIGMRIFGKRDTRRVSF